VGPLVFVRHAESEFNAHGLINADPAIANPLSPRGIEQAARLRAQLRAVSIDACFTSQLLRTRQTAGVALSGRSVPIIQLPDLNEPAAGRFEGGPVDTYDSWVIANGYWERSPGGESQVQALYRYIRAFRSIVNSPGERLLVVAHALPIAWLKEGLRAGNDGAIDLGINFEEPGVEMTTPYPFTREQVVSAADALAVWLHGSTPEMDGPSAPSLQP
jgi:broad specificity phosphatase PhoE